MICSCNKCERCSLIIQKYNELILQLKINKMKRDLQKIKQDKKEKKEVVEYKREDNVGEVVKGSVSI